MKLSVTFASAFVQVGRRLMRACVTSDGIVRKVTKSADGRVNPGEPLPIDPTAAIFFTVSSVHHAKDHGRITSISPLLSDVEAHGNQYLVARDLAAHVRHMAHGDTQKAVDLMTTIVAAYLPEYTRSGVSTPEELAA